MAKNKTNKQAKKKTILIKHLALKAMIYAMGFNQSADVRRHTQAATGA